MSRHASVIRLRPEAEAEYRRLHDRTQQQSDLDPIFSPREATKQEVDPNAAQ